MADVESIKSPGSSPSRPKGPDPLVDVAAKPTKFQVWREGGEGGRGEERDCGVCSREGAECLRVVHVCARGGHRGGSYYPGLSQTTC